MNLHAAEIDYLGLFPGTFRLSRQFKPICVVTIAQNYASAFVNVKKKKKNL